MTYVPLSRLVAGGRPDTDVIGRSGGRPVEFGRFAATARQVAGRLRGGAGRRAALVCRDSVWFAAALLGLLHAGARVVIPASAKPGYLADLTGRVDVIACDEPVDAGVPVLRVDPEGGPEDRLGPLDPEASTIEFSTSGSTGASKGVVKPLACVERECETLERMWGAEVAGASALATVPHQHVYGMTFKVLWPLSAGRPFVGETHDLWEGLLADLPPGAVIVTSPAHLTRLAGLAPLPDARRPRMVLSAGAPLPAAAVREAAQVLGVLPTEIFGSTETGAIASRRHAAEDEPWQPLPGITLAAREDGRLVVGSPFVPGGRHEGADLVDFTPDGRFRFRGRADRIAKIEGKRVSLPDVEDRLARLALVTAAAATVLTGGKAPRLAAAVVLSGEGRTRLAELGAFRLGRLLRRELGRTLESAALPSRWRYVDALPSGSLGKRRDADVQALFLDAPR